MDNGEDSARQPDDFVTGYEAAARRLFSRIERACALDAPWPQRVRVAVDSVLALLAADPARARLLLDEPYLHGRAAQRRHEEMLARLAGLLAVGREAVDCPPVPPMVEEGLIGGATFIVGRPLRMGEPELLPSLAPELTALLLAPYLGREEAQRVAVGGDPLLD